MRRSFLSKVAAGAIGLAGLLGSASVAKADDELTRRRHTPAIFDTPIRLEYPSRTVLTGIDTSYDHHSRDAGAGLSFYHPNIAITGGYRGRNTPAGRHDGYLIDSALGIAREDYDVELGVRYVDDDLVKRARTTSSLIDSDGLTNDTSESQREEDEGEDAAITLSLRRRFGDYGNIRVYGMVGRQKRYETVVVDNTTHVYGTVDIPGFGPMPIDTTAQGSVKVRTRRRRDHLDLAAIYDLAVIAPEGIDELALGGYVSFLDIIDRSTLENQADSRRIVDSRAIRRGYGIDLLIEGGRPYDGTRVMLAGRAGEDTLGSRTRFTGMGLLAITAQPFDDGKQWTLAGSGAGRDGVERYTLSIISLGHGDDKDSFDRALGLESVLLRSMTINSGFDQRFDLGLQHERTLDLYQLDMHAVGAKRGIVALTGFFQKVKRDRVGGFGLATLPYFEENAPDIGVFLGGYFGQERGERDYRWDAGVSWRIGDGAILETRVSRIGTVQDVETTFKLGIALQFGGPRPGYHQMTRELRDPVEKNDEPKPANKPEVKPRVGQTEPATTPKERKSDSEASTTDKPKAQGQ